MFNVVSKETGILYTVFSVNTNGDFLIYANSKFQWVSCDSFYLATNKDQLFLKVRGTEFSQKGLFQKKERI